MFVSATKYIIAASQGDVSGCFNHKIWSSFPMHDGDSISKNELEDLPENSNSTYWQIDKLDLTKLISKPKR